MGNALKPLAKRLLIPLGLMTGASAGDADIHKEMLRTIFITLIISNKEMNDIMKIVQSLEESELLIKSVSEKIKNEAKEQKGGFLGMLLGMIGDRFLGRILKGKGTIRARKGKIRAGKNI